MNKYIKTFKLIEKQVEVFNIPWVTKVSEQQKDPYKVLISCILSLRTKDSTTHQASVRLFKKADSFPKLVKLSSASIKKLIYPVGFYRKKARVLLDIGKKVINEHGGKVPSRLEDLLKLKGVGRKTANLVLGLSFNKPAICVDTHVHRISNRLGWIKTNSPLRTELALNKIMPKNYWIRLNTVLVAFGQNLCLPVSPLCSKCAVKKLCKKSQVYKSR